MSNVVEKVKEKVEQVLHKDHHHNTATGQNTAAGTYGTSTHTGTTHTGPHSSGIANAADPRVDSDRDGSANAGAASYGPGGQQSTGVTGSAGAYGTSTNAGPHDSNIANKLDPRVDSDRDGSANLGAASYGPGAQNTSSGGAGFSTSSNYNSGSTNAGPHSSNLANKLDPRVDSDRDGSANLGAASYGPGAQNSSSGGAGFNSGSTGYDSTNAGPHDSNFANKLDPRVDSDRDGSANMGAASYGPGAQNTANTGSNYNSGSTNTGPHSSNFANKLDPRVDSDRDGSANAGLASQGPGAQNTNTGAFGGGGATY